LYIRNCIRTLETGGEYPFQEISPLVIEILLADNQVLRVKHQNGEKMNLSLFWHIVKCIRNTPLYAEYLSYQKKQPEEEAIEAKEEPIDAAFD
jgi:hypothetical protein